MTTERPLLSADNVRLLIPRLAAIPSVRQFDQPSEPQAATLAHSLTDLERSFRAVLETLLPRLLDPVLTAEDLNNVLLEIGEELRHVLYHIRDPKFFDYLFDDKNR
jgi:hypothetical protein